MYDIRKDIFSLRRKVREEKEMEINGDGDTERGVRKDGERKQLRSKSLIM